jgi:hypothetical protein
MQVSYRVGSGTTEVLLKPQGSGENYPAAERQAEKGLWELSWDFGKKFRS